MEPILEPEPQPEVGPPPVQQLGLPPAFAPSVPLFASHRTTIPTRAERSGYKRRDSHAGLQPDAGKRQARRQRMDEDEQHCQQLERQDGTTRPPLQGPPRPSRQPEPFRPQACKLRTLSDSLAIQHGAAATGSDGGAGKPTPFWLEAGMRPAINHTQKNNQKNTQKNAMSPE